MRSGSSRWRNALLTAIFGAAAATSTLLMLITRAKNRLGKKIPD